MPEYDIERAKRSSRVHGAVGENPVVYRLARTMLLPHHSILDFGAGKHAAHTNQLRLEGHNVTAHDYHAVPGVHDPDALKRRYHVVLASNVLNVQNSPSQLAGTLNDLANSVDPAGGFAIVNLPKDPRYDAFKGHTNQSGREALERALKRRFDTVERHPESPNSDPVYILRGPKYTHST